MNAITYLHNLSLALGFIGLGFIGVGFFVGRKIRREQRKTTPVAATAAQAAAVETYAEMLEALNATLQEVADTNEASRRLIIKQMRMGRYRGRTTSVRTAMHSALRTQSHAHS